MGLIQRTLHTYLAACRPAYGLCQVRDASVLRYSLLCIKDARQAIFMMNNTQQPMFLQSTTELT